jgi:hypothetical protein
VLHEFNGVSDLTQTALNGQQITPPDQGLCVGQDPTLSGHPTVVWEPVNTVARETTFNGTPVRPAESLGTLFNDPNHYGDVRCLYDPASRAFYFTDINAGATIYTQTGVDVAVLDSKGLATYTFSTSMGTHCLGDQPKTGFDDNALVVSTDEYCTLLTTHPTYRGAIVLAISKSELLDEAATVSYWTSTPVSMTGIPVTGLDPAINTGAGTEYLVNSVPYLTNIATTINPVGDTLGLTTLHTDASVTTGSGTPYLTSTTLASEPYAYPVRAVSTGSGVYTLVKTTKTTTTVTVYSETTLNPDTSRMSGPVEVTHTRHGIELWTAICVAVVPHGTKTARDGAAWFEIDATRGRMTDQGYVAAKRSYLIYPALQPAPTGTPRNVPMVFTDTSQTTNPSAAYTTLGSHGITIVADGTGPGETFDITQGFRWGDYSFAASSNGGTWLATEYVPPKSDQGQFSNWGTFVFEVPQGCQHGRFVC